LHKIIFKKVILEQNNEDISKTLKNIDKRQSKLGIKKVIKLKGKIINDTNGTKKRLKIIDKKLI
jgi:NAD-dependent SIR2 family protein deacetylase